ncbi:MAG TPA: hypothetical protein VN238_14905 [Solirubrobacteraceae bacterium]|nr:hypothetical protein [Solirubrobacteraceae bacterium]
MGRTPEAGFGRSLIREVADPSALPASGTVSARTLDVAAQARRAGLGVLLDVPAGASVEETLDAQAEVATLLVAPPGVEAAEEATEHVRAHALRQPGAGDPGRLRRVLYARVEAPSWELSDPGAREWLAESFSPIDVDGYLVSAPDFDGGREATAGLLAFAHELQRIALRPVVLKGVGSLWRAALAGGLAGAVGAAPADDELYHGMILGSVGLDGASDVVRRRLFMRHACGCGHHPEGAAPEGVDAVRAHNAWWFEREIVQATAQPVDRATLLLGMRAAAAAQRREKLGLEPLPSGWTTVLDGDVAAGSESDARSDA